MKILTVDIETAPNLADVWSLWNVNVSLNQLREASYTLCWAAKFHGSKTVMFGSEWTNPLDFVVEIHALIGEADVIVGYNQDAFDLKTLNKDFILNGLGPPDPYQSVDLYKVVKKQFRFPSSKLDYVSQQLKIGAKVKHEGHGLWTSVMKGDEKAQKRMEKYCKGDVVLTEKLYDKLIPWTHNHPNRFLYDEANTVCTRCTKGNLVKRGFYYTANSRFQTYRCNNCGGYQRDTTRVDGVTVRGM